MIFIQKIYIFPLILLFLSSYFLLTFKLPGSAACVPHGLQLFRAAHVLNSTGLHKSKH